MSVTIRILDTTHGSEHEEGLMNPLLTTYELNGLGSVHEATNGGPDDG